MVARDDYERTMDERLALWEERREAMRALGVAQIKTEYLQQLEEWRAGSKTALANMAALKAAAGSSWAEIKLELEKARSAIESVDPTAMRPGRPRRWDRRRR